jgi:deoxyribonuclease-4
MSIAGSVANAPLSAGMHGYKAFQLFTSSSRSWEGRELEPKEVSEFSSYLKSYDLVPFAHIPYLCNPASANPEVHKKSIDMLVENLHRCMELGIGGIVVHMGSHLGEGFDKGLENTRKALSFALDHSNGVSILLENSAGYRNSMGSKFDEIGAVIDTIGSDRLGVCLDTCHAFAAGYDIRTEAAVDKTVAEFDSNIGIGRLKLVHLNDSRFGLGEGLDRHWHIGKGRIGINGFISLFKNKSFTKGSFIMETPINGEGDEKTNMKATLSAIKKAGASVLG